MTFAKIKAREMLLHNSVDLEQIMTPPFILIFTMNVVDNSKVAAKHAKIIRAKPIFQRLLPKRTLIDDADVCSSHQNQEKNVWQSRNMDHNVVLFHNNVECTWEMIMFDVIIRTSVLSETIRIHQRWVERCLVLDIRFFEAKNRVFKFDY